MTKYDYLVVGAGLFGATFAYEAAKRGKKVKVIEKRDHIAGNIYTKEVDGIQVHQYGAHIFHTSNKKIWDYIKKNNLQDPTNKRNINPDDKLAKVFGSKNAVDMFQMTKLVSKHIVK